MRVISEIARGGFGVVDKIECDDGTVVARKTLCPSFPITESEYSKLRKRFNREVSIQSSLASSNFMPIIHYELDNKHPWYTMPLAEKNFLEQIDEDRQKGTICRSALSDILTSLEELHQLGFVHRDLKPQNILLHDGKWKLTDFGLVRPPQEFTTQLTSSGSNWGTEMYCAPEQAIAFKNATHWVDIYAFGCILHDIFEMVPRLPYNRQTGTGPIGAIIEKCTEIKPEKRFKDVKSLRSALLTYLETTSAKKASPKASEWIEELKHTDIWDSIKLHEFCRFVITIKSDDDIHTVFTVLDEDIINNLYKIDFDLWKAVVLNYCEWIKRSSFSFDYCDVISPRLELIYKMGDYECKAVAVLSGAELASSHNRWYVMRAVVRMCNTGIDDFLAQRISIEIVAMQEECTFIICAERIGLTIDSYHPIIKSVLEKTV